MAKLFEILAVEKTKNSAANKLAEESASKFGKDHFFTGYNKSLSMLKDSPENKAIESASKEVRELPTTVEETLEYFLGFWAEAEDVTYAKNVTNQKANSDIVFFGSVIAKNVPVDELMGLEVRLENLRKLVDKIPTLDASKEWRRLDTGRKGMYQATVPEVTNKTEKTMTAIVLYPATDKHPAQIEKVNKDETVGTFTRQLYSGAATSKQKANVIAVLDELIVSTKQARMRANAVDAVNDRIGDVITGIILKAFKE